MKSDRLPVTAAIPAYNAESTLEPLLKTVLEQEYDQIFVLDDASTDATYELAHTYEPDITAVRGMENVGSGANRNRIIQVLDGRTIIHFLDADLRLNSEQTPELARHAATQPAVGYVGGLIRDPNGRQNPYNYGPEWSVRGMYS